VGQMVPLSLGDGSFTDGGLGQGIQAAGGGQFYQGRALVSGYWSAVLEESLPGELKSECPCVVGV